MKILHTADWHIGQRLYGNERYEEFEAFLDFLLQTIIEQNVELLLVSGDIFDIPHPSNQALELYYKFLAKLVSTPCRNTVITGGNHDSVKTLNAPATILKAMNAHIIGGATQEIRDEIITISDAEGNPATQIAAVPFLRDRDLRQSISGQSGLEKEIVVKEAIVDHYQQAASLINPDLPSIAMGHLFAVGVSTSDSERDIHVGNLGAISASDFPDTFNYVALGHIHRPQKVGGKDMIRYSGSPITLSFSEIKDEKEVVLLDLDDNQLTIAERIKVPKTRQLIRIKGNLKEVTDKILSHQSEHDLQDWAEVLIEEETYSPQVAIQFEALMEEGKFDLRILKYHYHYDNQTVSTNSFFEQNQSLEDLKPIDVFEKRIESLEAEEQSELKSTFQELLAIKDQQDED